MRSARERAGSLGPQTGNFEEPRTIRRNLLRDRNDHLQSGKVKKIVGIENDLGELKLRLLET